MLCLSSNSFSVGTWGKRGPKAEAVTPGALVPIAGNEVWSAPLPLLPLDGRCGSSPFCLYQLCLSLSQLSLDFGETMLGGSTPATDAAS